jgi:hypothetical protein
LKSVQNGLKSVCLAGFALMWLLFANIAAADDTATVTVSAFDDGTGDLPPGDFGGWFFNPDPNLPFPPEPDPSQPWTSPENLETINYWLSLITEWSIGLDNDSSNAAALLSQLYALGMISSPNLTPAQIGQVILSNEALISQETDSATPEPATLGLLGGGLALLGLYGSRRLLRRVFVVNFL